MWKRKLIADLRIVIILLGLLTNVSLLALSYSSKTIFSGVVYASPSIPVEGAYVTASGPEDCYGFSITDLLGQYNIAQDYLMTGNYNVTASATGYLDTKIENVAVTAGLETSNIDFLLVVSGAISGKVTDAVSGLPLQSVLVNVNSATDSGMGMYGWSAFTDANGNYLINTNLATGTYNVTVSYATGHIMKSVSGIAVITGIETPNVDLALERSGIISGTVTDSVSSVALQDILITAWSADMMLTEGAITNSSGQYSIDTNLAAGTYNVSAVFPEGYVPRTVSEIAVTAGSEVMVNLALDPSGIISGRITTIPGDQPVAHASVSAFSGDFVYFGSAETNATGYYMISSGLGNGTYTVFASFESSFNQTTGVNVVAGSETSDVNIQLAVTPSGTITGRVTNTTGSPIEYALVIAEGPDGYGEAITDSNGDYTISSGLGTGTYTVNASAFRYEMESVSNVSVTVNEVTSNVDFQLSSPLSGRISGKVEADMMPIPEFPQPIFIFLLVVSSIAVAFVELYATRLKRTEQS